jgi:hypothetical protein
MDFPKRRIIWNLFKFLEELFGLAGHGVSLPHCARRRDIAMRLAGTQATLRGSARSKPSQNRPQPSSGEVRGYFERPFIAWIIPRVFMIDAYTS